MQQSFPQNQLPNKRNSFFKSHSNYSSPIKVQENKPQQTQLFLNKVFQNQVSKSHFRKRTKSSLSFFSQPKATHLNIIQKHNKNVSKFQTPKKNDKGQKIDQEGTKTKIILTLLNRKVEEKPKLILSRAKNENCRLDKKINQKCDQKEDNLNCQMKTNQIVSNWAQKKKFKLSKKELFNISITPSVNIFTQTKNEMKSKIEHKKWEEQILLEQIQTVNFTNEKVQRQNQQIKKKKKIYQNKTQIGNTSAQKQPQKKKEFLKQKQIVQQNRMKKQQDKKKETGKEQERQIKNQVEKLSEEIEEANKVIPLATLVGEVAGYCSQTFRKSKLGWMTPIVLLYKASYSIFKSYEKLYERAAGAGLVKESEKQKYFDDNGILLKVLQKMVSKKSRIKVQYHEVVKPESEVDCLKFIFKEVLSFSRQVGKVDECTDPNVQLNLLRMVNACLILASLKGEATNPILSFEEIEEKDICALLRRKVQSLTKLRM